MPLSQRRQSVDALAKYLGYVSDIVAREQSVARYSGAAPIKSSEGKWLHQFFERNQMNRLTDALRNNTTDIGAVYFDSLAHSINGSGFLGGAFKDTAARSFRDLGVPKGQEAAFAKFVVSLKNQIPSPTQLQSAGAMGKIYGTVMQRFVNTTVLYSDSTTRPAWANSQWGSLVYQLGSYTGTFHDKFLRKGMNQAVASVTEPNMNMAERAQLATGMLPGLMLMGAASYYVMEIRDKILELAGTKKNLTEVAKGERAISNANLMGRYGRIFEQFGQQRYGGSGVVAGLFTPPGVAQFGKGADATWKALTENESKNTGERQLAKWFSTR
jgi:hypothetical protein